MMKMVQSAWPNHNFCILKLRHAKTKKKREEEGRTTQRRRRKEIGRRRKEEGRLRRGWTCLLEGHKGWRRRQEAAKGEITTKKDGKPPQGHTTSVRPRPKRVQQGAGKE